MTRENTVISIVNSKGGVAKTCTAVNLAATVVSQMRGANRPFKALLIDQDPQMNATGLLMNPEAFPSREKTLWAIYRDEIYDGDGVELIHPTRIDGLCILPSSLMLEGVEMRSGKINRAQLRLKEFMESCCSDFDMVFIDNGPSVNVFSINSLLASSHYIMTTTPEKLSIDGMAQLESTAVGFAKRWNPSLARLGVVLTIVDRNQKSHLRAVEDLSMTYADRILGVVHSSDVMRESCFCNQTVLEHSPDSPLQREFGVIAYNLFRLLGMSPPLDLGSISQGKKTGGFLNWFSKLWRHK